MSQTVSYYRSLFTHVGNASAITRKFIDRVNQGALTRDEGRTDHLCVYFAAHDPKKRLVFIGHHKTSGLWLFNGGHIDRGETPQQAVLREIGEEWGTQIGSVPAPGLLTIAEIETKKIHCTRHYDIWFFFPVDADTFSPDAGKLATEFFQTGWKTLAEAKRLTGDNQTIIALNYIAANLW